jgi:FkbM family methyltransferase
MKRLRSGVRAVFLGIVRLSVARAWSRKLLNAIYLKLNPDQRSRFHREAAKLFRTNAACEMTATWTVDFHGKPLLMPLTTGRLWLDWDSALSIVGHDIEVKRTYLDLISSPEAPDLFLDIGANYGTHSLLFLIHQIETLSFEPNSACHAVFRELCDINGMTPQLVAAAVGADEGNAELFYPARDTWEGSTNRQFINRLASRQKLFAERVRQTTVDRYLARMEDRNVLIKIDTEGSEAAVLRGASETLRRVQPKVIFECWPGEERGDIFEFLQAHDYEVHALPWSPMRKSLPLGYSRFVASSLNNFIALPTMPAIPRNTRRIASRRCRRDGMGSRTDGENRCAKQRGER